MYGDSSVIRKRAGQVRDQGADVRALADQLVATTEALGWTGRAARDLHTRVTERAAHLRAAAASHVTAADLLVRHAQEVAELQDRIAETEDRFHDLRASGELATDAEPPPPGHKDWLTFELP